MKKQGLLPIVLLKSISIILLVIGMSSCKQSSTEKEKTNDSASKFKGKIALDVRDSEADWSAYTPKVAPKGAPNILFILYDDTGLGAWSPYGGGINMPTMDRLAANGLTYSQWHTTALCSPTRSTIQTGRNHHLNGMAAITETADGFPGANGRIGAEVTPLSKYFKTMVIVLSGLEKIIMFLSKTLLLEVVKNNGLCKWVGIDFMDLLVVRPTNGIQI